MHRRTLLRWGATATATASVAARGQTALAGEVEETRFDRLRLFVAKPGKPGTIGVPILPTIAGATTFTRKTAADLAAAGMTAIVWDPYDGQAAPVGMIGQLPWSKRVSDTQAVDSLERIVSYMKETLGIEKVCSVGWCLGGRVGLIHAGSDPRVAAVTSYSPTVYSPTPVTMFGSTISRSNFAGQTMERLRHDARHRRSGQSGPART